MNQNQSYFGNSPDSHASLQQLDLSQTQGLIFDCDGTLADTMPLHYVAWQKTMKGWGINFSEDYFYALAGTPTVHIVQRLLDEHGIHGNAAEIAHQKEGAFLDLLHEVQPIEPIVEIARQFRSNRRMGVGSGSNRAVVLQILQQIGLGDLFSVVVGAEDTVRHKPEPDVFLEVASRIGVAPEKCCVFEDADLGIEAARRGGMQYFDIRTIFKPRRMT